MNFDQFVELAKQHNLIPVYEKTAADLLTPVSAYLNIRGKNNNSFLLESVEGIGRFARYSFIGNNPEKVIYNTGNKLTVKENEKELNIDKNIFQYLREESKKYNPPKLEELPAFSGGVMGFLGFENVSLIEEVIEFDGIESFEAPDSFFGIYNTIAAFDHFLHQLIIIHNVRIDDHSSLEEAFNFAKRKIHQFKREIRKNALYSLEFKLGDKLELDIPDNEFMELVESAKKNIYEGDVFQLVLSKRFGAKYSGDLLNVYRALRIINPSPYMYFMEFENEITVAGTSPEDLLKVNEGNATILPIAGTRKRGKDETEDIKLEKNLLNDPKEIAEHTMLVDLARNDLGRICDFDTVKVAEKFNIHRFSHVMHIVSRVEGKLKQGEDSLSALEASFPAGTVSGAPKIRAIQLISEYEKLKRNIYAGAVGYIDFRGNLDLCIAIRTFFALNDIIYWQAGAGIVADSKPELELKEIHNKSAALVSALKFAEVIDEDPSN